MKEKKRPHTDKRKNRKPTRRVSNHELQEKIDELVSLLFEDVEKDSTLKERKSDK